jgi:large subunit ribosomal protein L24
MIKNLFSFKIKKGDIVSVQVGKDKGKTGKVLNIYPYRSLALVSGVNISFKHVKPTQSSEGGINKKEMPIHISNLSLMDPKVNKPCKVGFKFLDNGNKVRYSKLSGEFID